MRILIYSAILFLVASCRSGSQKAAAPEETSDSSIVLKGPPSWSLQSNIYEVNLRQYGQNSSFSGFQNELKRLRDMGVEILWFMPITPISAKDRKGSLGSYYAVKDYRAVNPEYGNMAEWKQLVERAHEMGFKVITDWVPNHSGADNVWLTSHPDFYKRDSAGNAMFAYDWSDTRKLNYDNREFRDTMIACMKFWVDSTGIDGFRCDVAGEVPTDFWKECISTLEKGKDLFFLAEADKAELHSVGFDASYGWSVMSVLYGIYPGKTNLKQLDATLDSLERVLPAHTMRMYFTTNHDENSWNGTEFEKFGDGYKAFAVWTQTMKRSIPLIYSGQEEPNKKRLQFFEKDPLKFGKYALAGFYKTLLQERRKNPALATDASFRKINAGNEDALYAFVREKEGHKVAVIINLSKKEQTISINDDALVGEPLNLFMGMKEKLTKEHSFKIEPWGYVIYNYDIK
ncbi:MAG TPA: alpha-amylase family glycosyl hydrolase [Chitinophagaceae bacterium]|nr:alpha-amylase family glycosyl hydrolase [Chitinophagaceae bacterium]